MPTTLFSDNFNRADSPTVDATNWDELAAGDWAIVSNKVRSVNPLTVLITKLAAHAAVADCKVSYKRALTGSSWDTGVLVRTNSAGTTGYFLDPIGTGPASTIDIWRIDGNLTTDVQIGATATGLTLADGDIYALEVSGTGATVTLKAYLNGTLVLTVTDTSPSRVVAAGQTGIINWNNTNDFDDFLVEDLGGGNVSITPSVGSLTLAGVQANRFQNLLLIPTVGALALAGIISAVIGGTPRFPLAGALNLSGAAPVLSQVGITTPNAAALTLTGIAPVVLQSTVRVPVAGALTLTGNAPLMALPGLITPSTGALALTGFVSPQTLTVSAPATGVLALTGNAPTVISVLAIAPNPGALTLAGAAPLLQQTFTIRPLVGSLTLAGQTPALGGVSFITPNVGSLTLNGAAASVTVPLFLQPGTGALSLSGTQVQIVSSSPVITPFTGTLTFNGQTVSLPGRGTTTGTGGDGITRPSEADIGGDGIGGDGISG